MIDERVSGLPDDDQKDMRRNYHSILNQYVQIHGKIELGDETNPDVFIPVIRDYLSHALDFADDCQWRAKPGYMRQLLKT